MTRQHESRPNCPSACSTVTRLLLLFLALASPIFASSSKSDISQNAVQVQSPPIMGPGPIVPGSTDSSKDERSHTFTLRNIFHHGTYLHPGLHRRKDVINEEAAMWRVTEDGIRQETSPLVARSWPTKIERLRDRNPSVVDPMVAAARIQGEFRTLSPSAWTIDELPGPNITDKDTVITFARMAADAYIRVPFKEDWEDVNPDFDSDADFGWEGDGLRGHVFADESNSTIVISLKGTSLALWDGAETTKNDKENDNLFFSCCCAQQGQLTWRKVCDCATSAYTCNSTCLGTNLRKENRYYQAARHLYSNVTALYPDSNVWVTGHSLGGAVGSLMGLTYGLPTVTFEAPGQALAAKRLGLPVPPGSDPNFPQSREFTGVYNFGHTADPIYLGSCNGATGSCTYYGYAMETACHAGYECVYDVATDKGWRVGIGTHRIHIVIDDVLKEYDSVPECVTTPECQDCVLWNWFQSNNSDTKTSSASSTSTRTRTRTATCKTPGWWGCLDESTTSTATTTREVTTTSSTSTCKTPGWFGCYDKTATTTSTSTSTTPSMIPTRTSMASSSCQSPGWSGGCNDPPLTSTSSPTTTKECETPGMFYGCKDSTTTSSMSHPITSPPAIPSSGSLPSPTKHHKCKSKEWFGLVCADPPSTSSTMGMQTPAPTDSPRQLKCRRRSWLGYCKEWIDVSEGPVNEI